MSMISTTPSTSENKNRKSQSKRKPPPSTTLVDLELSNSPNDRYPPFDLDDPFASLTELRRRSRSLSSKLQNATSDPHHHARDTAPFDPPLLSPEAFPSEIQRRYTLDVVSPGSLAPSVAEVPPSADTHRPTYSKEAQWGEALLKLTTGNHSELTKSVDTDSVSNRSRDASAGRTSHQEHHRRYTHISMLFRAPSSVHLPQNGGAGTPIPTKSHYIPRKASSLSYMYTPPLTPGISGTSSSSSSLFDPGSMPTSKAEEDAIPPPPPKSPTPSTSSFVKKLLTKRSAIILPSLPRRKESVGAKDLPSLPLSPTPGAKTEGSNALGIPFPRSPAQASRSDVTLPTTLYFEKPKTTVSIIGASPQPSVVLSRLSPAERDVSGYATAPETRFPLGADLDAGLTPPRRTKLFGFASRSLFRSRVDLYETTDETGRKVNLSHVAQAEFDEFAPPTPKQLLTAAALSVISEVGVRVRFGDVWEKQKTVVIFVRHFRASACQDYVRSIASEVDVEALEKAGLKIVIVGMGSPSLITPYKQLTGSTFPIYTDPTLAVYHALGMTLRSSDRGPTSERGHYVVSRGGAFESLKRALAGATRLPLLERAGDTSQLGGEFILGPSSNECAYAHRMRTTCAHAPILDIVAASGVQTIQTRRVRGMRMRFGRGFRVNDENENDGMRRDSMEDEDAWMARRRRSLVRLRKKRQRRRAGIGLKEETVSVSDSGETGGYTKAQNKDGALELKRDERFSVVEEEDEDEDLDETDDAMLGVQ